jgi:hypothetical protein
MQHSIHNAQFSLPIARAVGGTDSSNCVPARLPIAAQVTRVFNRSDKSVLYSPMWLKAKGRSPADMELTASRRIQIVSWLFSVFSPFRAGKEFRLGWQILWLSPVYISRGFAVERSFKLCYCRRQKVSIRRLSFPYIRVISVRLLERRVTA